MDDLEARVRALEGWQRDVSVELRDWEAWVSECEPFLDELRAENVYRLRRRAEHVKQWSTSAKVLAALGGLLVALVTVGGFVLQVILLSRGAGAP